jgi:hypothetical protein
MASARRVRPGDAADKTFIRGGLEKIFKEAPITQILTMSGIPPQHHVSFLFGALRRPELVLANGQLTLGGYPLQINALGDRSLFRGQRTETVPLETMKALYESVVTSAEQFTYLGHSEKAESLSSRPCTEVTLENCATTLAWEIAGQSRDPGAVGSLVSYVARRLSPQHKTDVAELARVIAHTPPLCRLIRTGLAACGISDEQPSDADVICALCVIVGSHAGRYAYAYLHCCDNTAAAIGILSQSCPSSLPRSLGSLSPLLSQQLL